MRYRYLVSPPDFFGVEYTINPWMEGKLGSTLAAVASQQWQALSLLLTDTLGAELAVVPPQAGLPDLVFTANAGCIYGTTAVPSRFRHRERQGEEPFYRAALLQEGLTLAPLPENVAFEGAGDALFDEGPTGERPLLWTAYGFRTDYAACGMLAEIFDVETVPLQLIDPRFYHLDTCFCPLPGGYLLWYPPAFDSISRARVIDRVPEEKRYAITQEDALLFACNAVAVSGHIVLNAATRVLCERLSIWGFIVHLTPLHEFLKAGGSAKCLTLRLI